MTRIFTSLAVLLTAGLAGTFSIGFVTMALDLTLEDQTARLGLGLLIYAGCVLGHTLLLALRGRTARLTWDFRFSIIVVPLVLLLAYGAGWLTITAAAGMARHEIYLVHFTAGLFTSLGVLFVHCIIFTYFLGTGRWVKEVGLAYALADELLPRETRELKRIAFPAALHSMLVVIATVAAGAGRQLQLWPWVIHYALAILALHVNLWAFVIEFRCLSRNAEIITEVLGEVDRIRRARGLPSNAEAR